MEQESQFNEVQNPPNNNMIFAVLCTVLCCLPAGIYAIIKANSVNNLWYAGQYAEAQKAADDAKKFSIIGAAITLVFLVFYFIFLFVVASAASTN